LFCRSRKLAIISLPFFEHTPTPWPLSPTAHVHRQCGARNPFNHGRDHGHGAWTAGQNQSNPIGNTMTNARICFLSLPIIKACPHVDCQPIWCKLLCWMLDLVVQRWWQVSHL
jgi:hypothetical protein